MSKANLNKTPNKRDELHSEIESRAEQVIKEYLSPLQTKKLSKKMIEQIAQECASKISTSVISLSKKASSRYASEMAGEFSEIMIEQPAINAVFNGKLASVAEKMTPEDKIKFEKDQATAARVVSRVYKSIFDFALERGLKATEEMHSSNSDKNGKED